MQDRQQSINQKVQIKGNCWAWNGFVYGYFAFANVALIFFMIYLLTFNCQTSKIITLSELKDKLTSSTSKSYHRQIFRLYKNCRVSILSTELKSTTMLIFVFIHIICLLCLQLFKKSYIHKNGYWLFLPLIYMYVQCYHN